MFFVFVVVIFMVRKSSSPKVTKGGGAILAKSGISPTTVTFHITRVTWEMGAQYLDLVRMLPPTLGTLA